jgi:hypothetical protein
MTGWLQRWGWHIGFVVFGAAATGWQFLQGLVPVSPLIFACVATSLPLAAGICGILGEKKRRKGKQ